MSPTGSEQRRCFVCEHAELAEERRRVRLQYMSPLGLWLGDGMRRVRHRYHRHFKAHPLGQIPVEP